jgi:hypothetical protein
MRLHSILRGAGLSLVLLGLIYSIPALAAGTVVQSVITNGTPIITIPPPTSGSSTGSSTSSSPPATITTTGSSTTITGTAPPNTELTIQDNGTAVATTESSPTGSFSVAVPLAIGKNSITVRPTTYPSGIKKSAAAVSKPLVITRKATVLEDIKKVSLYVSGSTILLIGLVIIPVRLWTSHRRRKQL